MRGEIATRLQSGKGVFQVVVVGCGEAGGENLQARVMGGGDFADEYVVVAPFHVERVGESFVLVDQVIDEVMCSYQPPARLMLFSILQLLSLSEWKSVRPLKIRALRRGYPVYFRLQATFFYKRCRASVTKHR